MSDKFLNHFCRRRELSLELNAILLGKTEPLASTKIAFLNLVNILMIFSHEFLKDDIFLDILVFSNWKGFHSV